MSRAKHLRSNQTDAEYKLWCHLRNRQFNNLKFRRQVPFGNYIVDFVCHDAKLIVEVDGGQHADQQDYDAKRTAYLKSRGYHVIRFWNDDVLTNMEGVWNTLLDVVKTLPQR